MANNSARDSTRSVIVNEIEPKTREDRAVGTVGYSQRLWQTDTDTYSVMSPGIVSEDVIGDVDSTVFTVHKGFSQPAWNYIHGCGWRKMTEGDEMPRVL